MTMKGKSKGKSNVPDNNCEICGKPGHWSNECWMKKVNQVNNNPGSGAPNVPVPPSAPGGSSSSTTSTSSTLLTTQMQFSFRLLEMISDSSRTTQQKSGLSVVECEYYDMSASDSSDGEWSHLAQFAVAARSP